MEYSLIGTFKIKTDFAVVSDPVYDIAVWCQAIIRNVLNGNYKVLKSKHFVIFIHEDYEKEKISWKLTDFDLAVDSGRLGVFDFESFSIKDKSEGFFIEVKDGNYNLEIATNKKNKVIGFKIKICY